MVTRKIDYWYPWSPVSFRRECSGLNDIQELIYRRLFDFYMEVNKEPLEDNDQALANIARVPLQVWLDNADVIKSHSKLGRKKRGGGYIKTIIFQRCEVLIAEENRRRQKNSENGTKGGQNNPRKNKGLKASASKIQSTDTDTDTLHLSSNEDSALSPRAIKSQNDQIADQAFELYNLSAARAGIPLAQRLNATRKTRILARVKEVGGLEGWKTALEKLEASDFLCGRAKGRDFKANIDFILQEGSFTKLMEGNYDNGPRLTNNTKQSAINTSVEGFGRAADKHARKGRDGLESGSTSKNNLFD